MFSAKKLLIIGLILIAIPAVLNNVVPYAFFGVFDQEAPLDARALATLGTVITLVAAILLPIGTAAMAAGFVGLYLERVGRRAVVIPRTRRSEDEVR